MEPIAPPIDYFQDALKIDNYFDIIDYCEKLDVNICNNSKFWKEKYEYLLGYPPQGDLNEPEFKAAYQLQLSNDLHTLAIYPNSFRKNKRQYYQKIYGTDKEDLLDKAEYLRKEANKVFPLEYDKTLYRTISGYPHNLSFQNIRSIVGTLKPGQLIIMSLYPDNLEGSSLLYIYQLGDDIRSETTDYPDFPIKLFQDTPRGKIKEIYNIDPYSEKL